MFGLQLLQLDHQLIELGIADLGIIEHKISIFVMPDLVAQRLDLFSEFFCYGDHRKRL